LFIIILPLKKMMLAVFANGCNQSKRELLVAAEENAFSVAYDRRNCYNLAENQFSNVGTVETAFYGTLASLDSSYILQDDDDDDAAAGSMNTYNLARC
jgi:hypothetical protein